MKISVKGCVGCPFLAFKQRGFYGEVDVCAAADDRETDLTLRSPPGFAPDWCPANGEGVTVISTKPSELSKIVTAYVPRQAVDLRAVTPAQAFDDDDDREDPWIGFFDQGIPF